MSTPCSLALEGKPKEILLRALDVLDTHLTEVERSGLRLGGGTVLAMRWHHRLSTDIDLAMDEAMLSRVGPA